MENSCLKYAHARAEDWINKCVSDERLLEMISKEVKEEMKKEIKDRLYKDIYRNLEGRVMYELSQDENFQKTLDEVVAKNRERVAEAFRAAAA